MLKPICNFDFETDTANPETANPVEVACHIIDQFNLEVIRGSEFVSKIRPEGIDSPDYFTEERNSTIAFHCKLKKCTKEELIEEWKSYPLEKDVWQLFVAHVNKYNRGATQWDAPIPAGQNIINFDLPIIERLKKKYGTNRLFNHEVLDLRHISFLFLIWDTNLRKRSMDSLRDYFGISGENAHTAMKDVEDVGLILCRFLKYCKSGFSRSKFKDSFKKVEAEV